MTSGDARTWVSRHLVGWEVRQQWLAEVQAEAIYICCTDEVMSCVNYCLWFQFQHRHHGAEELDESIITGIALLFGLYFWAFPLLGYFDKESKCHFNEAIVARR